MMKPALHVVPKRATSSDDPADLLQFVVDAFRKGPVALATLTEVRGGAARTLGSHVAVAADGRFCGYVSGGCMEAAVAAEALLAISDDCDRVVSFGEGSPFFDILLPCGGGLSLAIHVVRNIHPLCGILDQLRGRKAAGLCYTPKEQELSNTITALKTGWIEDRFEVIYRPKTRIIVSGRTTEAEAVVRLARACFYEVFQVGSASEDLNEPNAIDSFTAVVLLHHDLEAEFTALTAALRSPAFYVGALGGTRTHRKRAELLSSQSFTHSDIARIKAPIGIFGPARDTTSLALSVLADVAASRLTEFG